MKKHDGWCLKNNKSKNPLMLGFFHRKRRDVVNHIDKVVADGYKTWKKIVGKQYEIVKVKVTEVEEKGRRRDGP